MQKQLGEKTKDYLKSFYRSADAQISSGVSEVDMVNSTSITFLIPANTVINPSKITLDYNLNITQGGQAAGSSMLFNNFIPHFRSLSFQIGGTQIHNINNLHLLNKLTFPATVKKNNTFNSFFLTDSTRQFSNGFLVQGKNAGDNAFINVTVAGNFTDGGVYLNQSGTQSFDKLFYAENDGELNYVLGGCPNDVGVGIYFAINGSSKNIPISIPLSWLLPNSFFSIDQDIYIQQGAQLVLETNLVGLCGLESLGGYNGNYGGNASILGLGTTGNFNTLKMNNVQLKIYYQANEVLAEQVKQSSKNGRLLIIPSPYIITQGMSGTSQSGNFGIPRYSSLSKLYKIYYGTFSTSGKLPTDSGNWKNKLFYYGSNTDVNANEIKYQGTVKISVNGQIYYYLNVNKNEHIDLMNKDMYKKAYCMSFPTSPYYYGLLFCKFDTEKDIVCYDGESLKGLPMDINTVGLFDFSQTWDAALNHCMVAIQLGAYK